jgi:hypothetical protein
MTTVRMHSVSYVDLNVQIRSLLGGAVPVTYRACVDLLLKGMREWFPALSRCSNPIVGHMDWWSQDDLRFIITEYSGFSNAAVHMLFEARIRNRWTALGEEIERNIDEEMGILTGGVPHLELMRHGYRTELGIETEKQVYTAVTDEFIKRMHGLFKNSNNAFLAGVLLAFEGVAVEEFRIVEEVLRHYMRREGGDITPSSVTGRYIAGHVGPDAGNLANDPEMDHFMGIVDAVGSSVEPREFDALTYGFLSVCLELCHWWDQIAVEALQRRIRDTLSHFECTTADPYPDVQAALAS